MMYLSIVDTEFVEAAWQFVFVVLVGTITDLWHQHRTLVATTHLRVDTCITQITANTQKKVVR